MRMTDFQNMCGLSMAYRLRGQQARGHTDGVLAYVAYEGCWCMEHQLCNFAQPWLLQELVRGMDKVATCGIIQP